MEAPQIGQETELFMCVRKHVRHVLPRTLYWTVQYNWFKKRTAVTSICIHKTQRHLWAIVLTQTNHVAIKSPPEFPLLEWEREQTQDWVWPPHALTFHLISGHGWRAKAHPRLWEQSSDSYADERGSAHRPFPSPPCIVVIKSAPGTFICV